MTFIPDESSFMVQLSRQKAIERVLLTPKLKKQKEEAKKKEMEWYAQVDSNDPKVLSAIFRKEWPRFELYIKNSRDKAKIKKMFGIK